MITYLSGINASAKAHFLFRYINQIKNLKNCALRIFTFVKPEELNSFYDDLKCFFKDSIDIFLFPYDDMQTRIVTTEKIKMLNNFIVCATDNSINIKISNPKDNLGIKITAGKSYSLNKLVLSLSSFGYTRTNYVEEKLQFAVRGEIVDVWPLSLDMPVRIVFEYDNIETLRCFDLASQLSNVTLKDAWIFSVNISDSSFTIKDYFFYNNKENETIIYFDYSIDKQEEKKLNKCDLLINDPLNVKSKYMGYKSFTGFQGDTIFFVKSLKDFLSQNVKIKIYCANEGERERIVHILYDSELNCKNIEFLYGNLSEGFYLDSLKTVFVSSRQMLYKKRPVNFPKVKEGRRLEGIWEISQGDYVVHEKYGIGRYVGLKTISRQNSVSEYLCIEYKNSDKLYVPPEEIKTVKKYIGIEGFKPKLYSMDTLSWERVKFRIREAAAKFAKELLLLYAQRSLVKRLPLEKQTTWEKELEDSFPYEATQDQLKAIEDIKNDFSKSYPMERLICGDIGYGKTEIALRAAFKVVTYGRQVAVLVPTTVLAQQHYNTFSDRLSLFPTSVAVLSKFQSKYAQKKTVEDLKKGAIDIVVGTHRLLQKDVEFKNLGLLIIDEEHKFGVKQKEKIKSLKKHIDILLLSATPIPRTLSCALSGFRDLSLIETPPYGRLPIETNLALYDDNLVKNIIEAELSRSGQFFYVYNKVETILTKAHNIEKLISGLKLGVIHGQMRTKDIENVMWEFINFKLDGLIATTIIESGLDIPSVNTMIIEEAESFGLSQLYQLRGRIGRNSQKAYCYLLYKNKNLSDESIKRLHAMKDFSELGSGFRLALKDLEIRGAGAILSKSQHGFVRDIGYDMFSKLLKEEGSKLKGNVDIAKTETQENTVIDLQINALIPQDYIAQEDIRILFYRKLSDANSQEAIDGIKLELLDRFGKIPQETQMLLNITNLRLLAQKIGIERISEDIKYLYIYFFKTLDFSNLDIARLINNYSNKIKFVSGKHYAFKLIKDIHDVNIVEYIKDFLVDLESNIFSAKK
ncbi:MAG: transcription-repair coupling factor [Endomicrobium sp.]|jgi:transcription-repair coupling factor (superfamily II helicase)|nr:transcription-repair coupling factor [Endomicrobium sp.]